MVTMKENAPYCVTIVQRFTPNLKDCIYDIDNPIDHDVSSFISKKSLHTAKQLIIYGDYVRCRINYTSVGDKNYIYKELNKAIKIRRLQNLTKYEIS